MVICEIFRFLNRLCIQKVLLLWCPLASKRCLCPRYISIMLVPHSITHPLRHFLPFFVSDFMLTAINPVGLQQRPQS